MLSNKRLKLVTIAMILAAVMLAMIVMTAGCDNSTGDTWDKIAKKGVLTIGVDSSFPPLTSRNEKGDLIGFDIDLANCAAAELGLKIKFKSIEWSEKEDMLRSKKIDVIWSAMSKTPERAKAFLFSTPYLMASSVAIVRKDSDYTSMRDSRYRTMGVLEASSQYEWLKSNKPDYIKLVTSPDQRRLIDEGVINGDIDVMITDKAFGMFYVKHYNAADKVKIIDEGLDPHGYAVGMRKDDVRLAEQINKAIAALEESGKIAALKQKWFGDYDNCPISL